MRCDKIRKGSYPSTEKNGLCDSKNSKMETSDKMRILMVNAFFHPYQGGTEKCVLELSKRMAENHEVHVITSRLPDTSKKDTYKGIKIHRLPSKVIEDLPDPLPPPYPYTPGLTLQLRKKVKEIDPDIIHTHNRFFPKWNAPQLFRTLFNKPVFMTLHNAQTQGIDKKTDFFGQLYDNTLGKIIMKKADLLIGNSKDTLNRTAPNNMPEEKKKVIYNGIDTSKYQPTHEHDIKNELEVDKYTLTVSRLVKQKGLEYMVKALPKIIEESNVDSNRYKHVVIGQGPEKENLKELAEELGVSENLHFTGFVPEEKMTDYYTQANAFILPSLYEPFGIVLVESMACETPVIATDAGGIPEVLGDTGIGINQRNPGEIAENTVKLLENPEKAKEIGKKGRKRAKEKFEWDKITEKTEETYKDFLEKD